MADLKSLRKNYDAAKVAGDDKEMKRLGFEIRSLKKGTKTKSNGKVPQKKSESVFDQVKKVLEGAGRSDADESADIPSNITGRYELGKRT